MVDTVPVPGGRFTMGSLDGRPDERPVRVVTVAPFRLGRTPVSNAQYAAFLGESDVAEAPPWWRDPAFASPDQPVVGVTWFEAAAFAAWVGAKAGGRWRLPTEAEWERAMRGGREGAPTCWGERMPQGEVPEGPIAGPWSLGKGTPNDFGVCDPGTVVHEWCLDALPFVRRHRGRDGRQGPARTPVESGRLMAPPAALVPALGPKQPPSVDALRRLRVSRAARGGA